MLRVEARARLGALDLDVALETPPGGCLALAGPSGAGKTSILRVVAGLLRALGEVPATGLAGALADRGAVGSIAAAIFTDYLFPFELTSALLITAATRAFSRSAQRCA